MFKYGRVIDASAPGELRIGDKIGLALVAFILPVLYIISFAPVLLRANGIMPPYWESVGGASFLFFVVPLFIFNYYTMIIFLVMSRGRYEYYK
ncbi:hypothetical protein D1F64_18620 [Breoghania sp. L-A4]|nr:hypothetical protein D1F64_18620 [Breoghania sp. L-A4]